MHLWRSVSPPRMTSGWVPVMDGRHVGSASSNTSPCCHLSLMVANLTLIQGHTGSVYLIAGTSRGANKSCLGIKVAHIGLRHIGYGQTIYGRYILDLTILSACYNNTILMVCFKTNTFSAIFLEGQLPEEFSSYAQHNNLYTRPVFTLFS
jgi:hypothetical protein